MSNFTEPLILINIDGNLWKTEREFSYHIGSEDSVDIIKVPAGFSTDLASVPWPASMLIPKSGKFNQSACLHDFLYSILGELNPPYNKRKRTRLECDAIFLEAMQVLGVPLWKRRIMYRAVRMFGWIPWNFKNKEVRNERTRVLEDAKQQIPDD